jgi:membrane protein DedA with SNARE-associated domain
MLFTHLLPETQVALALSIFLATFIYEDGATLLAATLGASGSLDPRIGILVTILGIWLGDLGLYGLGSRFGRGATQSRWLRKYFTAESRSKAEGWFARHGSSAVVMSRVIPGSRLPLYLAAGALRFPVRVFARTTAICSAVWVSAIFAIWRFVPGTLSSDHKVLPWLIGTVVLFAPWLLGRIFGRVFHRDSVDRNRRRSNERPPVDRDALGLCAL